MPTSVRKQHHSDHRTESSIGRCRVTTHVTKYLDSTTLVKYFVCKPNHQETNKLS